MPFNLEPYISTYVFKTLYLPIMIKVVLAVAFPLVVLSAIPIVVWMERRGAGLIQDRMGPNRSNIAGYTFLGLLHPLNDAIKMVMKETLTPERAKVFFYYLAPALVVIPAIMAFAVIPVAAPVEIEGVVIPFQVATIDTGLLYIFAISSLGIYGIMMAGWASGNKFSMLGGLRAASQMLSYEMVLGISLVTLFMVYAEIEPAAIVESQGGLIFGFIPKWGIFLSPVAFFIFIAAAFDECNRTTVDRPEADSDIGAGYHLEDGGMKFAMFMMAEYLSIITMSAIITTMFFGGYQIPFLPTAKLHALAGPFISPFIQIGAFSVKTLFFIWLYIWARWTLPRFRYDQIMKLCYLRLFPIALANIFITAAVMLLIN